MALATGTPHGAGALFKCAICGDLVYETQLDYHVSICPDVGSLGDPTTSAGTALSTGYNVGASDSGVTLSLDLQQPLEVLYEAPDVEVSTGTAQEETLEGEPEASVDADVAAKDAKSEPLQRSESMPPLGVSRRVWRQWKDSEIERHHSEAEDRGKRRRQQLQDEMSRREADECTFAPRTLSRRSNSSGARMRTLPSSSPSGGEIGVTRQKRLERVEAELYAHVTLHPTISPYARAWGAREKEALQAMADREGRPAPSVFERLYAIAVQERRVREAREAREVSATPAEAIGASTRSLPDSASDAISSSQDRPAIRHSGSASSRSRLLYGDALDRRQKQRSLEAAEQREADRRAACQVLARSRRYYWQMLERQIKAAFDAACSSSGHEAHLTFARLEDFLRHFGCLKAPKASTPIALERAAEDSRKLRVSLWKYLDPRQIGYVDFLTLTVFFHVLMGAVDEEAQCLHNLSVSQQSEGLRPGAISTTEDSVAAAAAAALAAGSQTEHRLLSHGSSEALSSSCGLGAIYEEAANKASQVISDGLDEPCSPTTPLPAVFRSDSPDSQGLSPRGYSPGRAADGASSISATAASPDPEGQRICELLVRFDPKQLRTEFKQLYLDRLHSGTHSGQHLAATSPGQAGGDEPGNASFASRAQNPELNERSLALAERVVQRQRDDAGGRVSSHAELLHWRLAQTEAKKSEQRARKEAEEVQECTFHPSLRTARRSTSVERIPSDPRLPPHARLYANASRRQQEREAKAAMIENRRSEREREACTFRPDTSKSGRSYQRHGSALTPATGGHPRGYDQCKQRMRRAHAGHMQKKRLLEERFLPIDAASRDGVEERRPHSARASIAMSPHEVELPSAATLLPASATQPQAVPPPAPAAAAAPADPAAAPSATSSSLGPPAAAPAAALPPGRAAAASPRGGRAPTGRVRGQQKPQGAGRDVPRTPVRTRSGGPSKGTAPSAAPTAAAPPAAAAGTAAAAAVSAAVASAGAPAPKARQKTGPGPGSPAAAENTSGLGPAWTRGEMEAPAGERNMGSWSERVYTAEQQQRLHVDEHGVPAVRHPGVEADAGSTPSATEAAVLADQQPMVYVEVNIAPGRPPEKLILREGQSPAEAAAEFAVMHRLSPHMAQRLHMLLKELMMKPDLGPRRLPEAAAMPPQRFSAEPGF